MYDIVYFVKDTESNEELRYSLRSLKNFPHRKVWFYGGCPKGLKPDFHVNVVQDKENKWKNVGYMLRLCCNNKDISDKFYLFNDDFFIMQKVKKYVPYHNGDLYKRIVKLENHYKKFTPYSKILRLCCSDLESIGSSTLNYELHIPILLDKEKCKEIFNLQTNYGFRSTYSNYFKVDSTEHRDVKIVSLTKLYKDGEYLSTDDKSFTHGVVGQQIREKFNTKCKYEV